MMTISRDKDAKIKGFQYQSTQSIRQGEGGGTGGGSGGSGGY